MPQLDQDILLQFLLSVYVVFTLFYIIITLSFMSVILSNILRIKWLFLRADLLVNEIKKLDVLEGNNFLVFSNILVRSLNNFDEKSTDLNLLFSKYKKN